MEDLQSPILMNGFVLSLRPSEILLTFPSLVAPPQGLESEAQATLRYSNRSGQFTAIGRISRVAAGPPVTVTFKRLAPYGSDSRRPVRTVATLPVSVYVVNSSVSASLGDCETPGYTQNLSSTGLLIATSLLLAVGDVVRLVVLNKDQTASVHGRVIRVFENEDKRQGHFGVGIEFVYKEEKEKEQWHTFASDFLRAECK